MATKKTSKTSKASTKTPATTAGEVKHTGKALTGKAVNGKEMDLNSPLPNSVAGQEEVHESRPYTSRYPIDNKKFEALKATAYNTKSKSKTPKGLAVAEDKGKKTEVASFAIAAAPEQDGPAAAPVALANFAGIPDTGWFPPDCTVAAGPQHVLASVNSSVAIYNKTGGAPVLQRTLTQWFSNVIQGATIFDPKALYDQHSGRWVLLAVAFASAPNRSWFLLSVSKTNNPTGGWFNYSFDATKDGATSTNNWADFPGLGVDNQAIYLTANMFQFGGNFQYAKIRIIPKAAVYAGAAATFKDLVNMKNANGSTAFTLQPCHTYGAPQVEYLVNSLFPSGNTVTLWKLTNPLTTPVLTKATISTAAYSLPPNADQKGSTTPLNTGDVRILHAVFRGGSVWTALTTSRVWGTGTAKAAIHWFQINASTGALVQQGVYGAAGLNFFYPASCPDTNGNMIMVFARSGASEFASIFYTGRLSSDPLGTLQASALLKSGVVGYVKKDSGGRNRWGDYLGIANDPTDSRTTWVYGEFAAGAASWNTWIGSTRF
jgi:hypothetical protein